MLGIVFTSLIEMLEEKVSPEFADEVITEAGLESQGAYTAVGRYPYDELVKILTVLEQKTGKSQEELQHDFGYYLFGRLAQSHGQVMAGRECLLDALEVLDDDIHVQVKKLYPDADLPQFTVLSRTEKAMRLRYFSSRDLYALAEGLMDAAADHFGDALKRETFKTSTPHTYEFSLSVS